jgi:AcrR family transcriptional regulator
MSAEDTPGTVRAARGRPFASERRQVVRDLLDAVGQGLKTKTHQELTLREIGAMAGVNEAMISYYFKSKEGLLITLLDELTSELKVRFRELDAAVTAAANPMRPIVETLVQVYYPRLGIVRAIVVELMRQDSAVRSAYQRKTANTSREIMRLLRHLIDSGRYDPALDVRYAVLSVMSLIVGPLLLSPNLSVMGLEFTELVSDSWVDHVSGLLHAKFSKAG